ncbi:MAG: hypothetical protein OEY23_09800 [Acidimicrobiia bacterium]|nr:hypothetical protein [Acidimicrobiia bacterium]
MAAGRFADFVDPRCASVRFHAPVPLDAELRARRLDDPTVVEIVDGASLVATVSPYAPRPVSVRRGSPDDVAAAQQGWCTDVASDHPFPTCYVCGPQRRDGLGLRPGPVADGDRHLTVWSPGTGGDVDPWLVWAALDCPSGMPALAAVAGDELVVTGTLAVSIDAPVPGDEELQIVSRLVDRSGRKLATEAALFDATGRTLATCTAMWFALPRVQMEQVA